VGRIDDLDLGTFGIWTFDFEFQQAAQIRDGVQELEGLGWKTVWVPELLGRDAFTLAGFLLAGTATMHVVNGIAKIGAREAMWTHGSAVLLADAYPDRHIVGLGFGAARPGVQPLAAMTAYLDELDDLDKPGATPNPVPARPVRRILAAYGPKMLQVARDRSRGAHSYHVNVEHTASARDVLGPDAFLGVEHAVLFCSDPDQARAIAREHLQPYLNQNYNIATFRRLGYTEDEIGHGGADRIVDDLVFWGDLETIAAKLRQHVDAGADHVGVQVIGIPPGGSAMPRWRDLAGALLAV
jgi:probable F420-dependent oxidoreductase